MRAVFAVFVGSVTVAPEHGDDAFLGCGLVDRLRQLVYAKEFNFLGRKREEDAKKTYTESGLEDELVLFNGDLRILDLGRDHGDLVGQGDASWDDIKHSA